MMMTMMMMMMMMMKSKRQKFQKLMRARVVVHHELFGVRSWCLPMNTKQKQRPSAPDSLIQDSSREACLEVEERKTLSFADATVVFKKVSQEAEDERRSRRRKKRRWKRRGTDKKMKKFEEKNMRSVEKSCSLTL